MLSKKRSMARRSWREWMFSVLKIIAALSLQIAFMSQKIY